MNDQHKQHKQDREGFVKNDVNRENFFELHQRQKNTFADQADRLDKFETNATITINSLVRLRVYIMLTDLNLGPFVNEAKVRVRNAYLTGTRNWHEHYVHDVADVDVKLVGRSAFIRITPYDRFYFEFTSTGKPTVTYFNPAVGLDQYTFVVVGTSVVVQKGVMQTTPTILKQKRDIYGQNLSQIKRGTQVQLLTEPVQYPFAKQKYGRIRTLNETYQAYAPGNPWTGATLRDTDAPNATFGGSTICGPGANFVTRDHGFDIPWGDSEKKNPVRYAYVRGAADWPRASGKQLVKSKEYGSREFAIYVDAFGQFAIFPTSQIEPVGGDPPTGDPYAQNIDEIFVRRITPTLPTWCWKPAQKLMDYWASNPNVYELCVDQPEFDWKFHPEGTKCACIVIEREEHLHDSTYWAIDENTNCKMDATKFAAWQQWMHSETNYIMGFTPQAYNNHRYFIAPGIVELDIKIELTGPSAEDFNASIVVNELMRPSISTDPNNSPWPVFVDYVWHTTPKRTNTKQLVRAGTLVALTLELWIHPAGTDGELTDRQVLWSVRQVKDNVEVFSAVGAPLLGLDLKTLSMVLRLDGYSTDRRFSGDGTILNFPVHHFGAWIIHSGVGKEVLYPENTPDAMKTQIAQYAALNGREYFAAKQAATTGDPWFLLPVTTQYDGWGNTDVAATRDYNAYQSWYWYDQFWALVDADLGFYGDHVKYKLSGSPPGLTAAITAMQRWLTAVGGDWRNIMFCTSPRWGWMQYAALIPAYVALNVDSTFFTHPNGSYAFWSNDWIYDRNGLPGDYVIAQGAGGQQGIGQGSGADWTHNTLAIYNPTLIEHVIFDRVHFEIRATNQKAKSKNTTFLDLYNRAVRAGKKANTLEDNIDELTLADFRATEFVKEIGTDVDWQHDFLDLKMTWNGRDWWYRESGWCHKHDGAAYPPPYGQTANFNNLNVYCYWRSTNYAGNGIGYSPGSTVHSAPANWHARMCDPIILMEK